ncbi:MAG: hypothetical protein ACTSQE_00915 [Candidatus Heimdallarchaeaceae archaeon]
MSRRTSISRLIYFRDNNVVCTGGVVFIGDGKTGKTHTALNLTSFRGETLFNLETRSLKKSVNIEFNYFIFQSNIEEYQITTSSQLFIMPGQKGRAKVGAGLAFEDAVDLYFDIASVSEVLALVLTYNLADLKTFQGLEYWLNRAINRNLVQGCTSIILLGTHQDLEELSSVSDKDIERAKLFISYFVKEKVGLEINVEDIHSVKVSNISCEVISL